MVPHPDQTGLPPGALRFVLSLRATGEGHISSITFRTGLIHPDQRIEVDTPGGFLTEPRQIPNPLYEKGLFERKLSELGLAGEIMRRVMNKLGESSRWTNFAPLSRPNSSECLDGMSQDDQHVSQGIWTLARSNYEVQFQPEQQISERILFPATPSQRNGIEDARFVCFRNDDGTCIYYATFTAYDGRIAVPELVETSDFLLFRFRTLNGPAAESKGMPCSPGRLAACMSCFRARTTKNIDLMFSRQHSLLE